MSAASVDRSGKRPEPSSSLSGTATWVTKADLAAMLNSYTLQNQDNLRELIAELYSSLKYKPQPRSRSSSVSSTKTDLYVDVNPITTCSQLLSGLDNLPPIHSDELDYTFLANLAGRHQQAFVIEHRSPILITRSLKLTLKAWLDSESCRTLWVQGPSTAEVPTRNTAVAVALTSVFASMDIPCIFHFCTHMVHTPSMDEFYHSGLLALIADLCEQLGRLVTKLPRSLSLDRDRLSQSVLRLKANPTSIPLALNVLEHLLELGPPRLVCIIDNINILEDLGRPEHCVNLKQTVDILTKEEPTNSHRDMYRLCFTTDGFSSSLGDLSQNDGVECFIHDRIVGADDELAFNNWPEPPS